jgi:hypothetical protein
VRNFLVSRVCFLSTRCARQPWRWATTLERACTAPCRRPQRLSARAPAAPCRRPQRARTQARRGRALPNADLQRLTHDRLSGLWRRQLKFARSGLRTPIVSWWARVRLPTCSSPRLDGVAIRRRTPDSIHLSITYLGDVERKREKDKKGTVWANWRQCCHKLETVAMGKLETVTAAPGSRQGSSVGGARP